LAHTTRRGAGSPGAGTGGYPSPPAPGCFSDTLDALRADVEKYRQQATEAEGLIAKLTVYANGAATAEPGASPSTRRKRRRRLGRPPSDAADNLRVKRRNAMRARRALLKAAAADDSKKRHATPRRRRIRPDED
jgi:hypothetical protein